MGIKDFLKAELGPEKKKVQDFGEFFDLNFIEGKKVVIDAFNVIYKNMYVLKEHLTFNGQITTHIKITLQKIRYFQKLNVQQFWIFDEYYGNKLKEETVNKRTLKLEREHVEEIKKLLSLCGIKWISVKIEAEFYAAELTKGDNPLYDVVLSSDMDVIIRGGVLLKESLREGKRCYFYLNGETMLKELKISSCALAKMAVMLGCDFAPKSLRVGPKSVWKKRNEPITPRQQEAVDFLCHKIDMCGVIHKKPETKKENKEELNEWLLELGFSI